MSNELDAWVFRALDRLAGDMGALGVALSGGGDSMALLHLAQDWAAGRRLMAATVDHGLREGSGPEAVLAGQAAARLGVPHSVLRWQHGPIRGNLMAAARDARLALLSQWARQNGLSAVLLGHTQDDQAETLLMRLGRGAGVDGLSGMAEIRHSDGMLWLRPLLGVQRQALRDWLAARRIAWTDDPSNENAEFERVRIRKVIEALQLPIAQLASVSANLASARDALRVFAQQVAEGAQMRAGSVLVPQAAFDRAPDEIRRRLMVAGVQLVAAGPYPPRRETVAHALRAVAAGLRTTLDGVIVEPAKGWLHFIREPAAASRVGQVAPDGAGMVLWDRRWRLGGLHQDETVAVLGHDALSGFDWRGLGLRRDEAASTPAVWKAGGLVAAPALHPHARITAQPLRTEREFRRLLYSH